MSSDDSTASDAIKVSFLLSKEEAGGCPISAESIWCRPSVGHFQIKNVPFLLEGVSFDDVVEISPVGDGRHVISRMVERSGNSTIWLSVNDAGRGGALVNELVSMGCGVEGGLLEGYYAVNVPSVLDIADVYSAMDEAIACGALMADYPSLRHHL